MSLTLIGIRCFTLLVDLSGYIGRSLIAPAKNMRTYFGTALVTELALTVLSLYQLDVARVLFWLAQLVLSLVFLEGRVVRRLLAFALGILALALGEAAAMFCLFACTGVIVRSYEELGSNLLFFFLAELLDMAVVLGLMGFFGHVTRRLWAGEKDTAAVATTASNVDSDAAEPGVANAPSFKGIVPSLPRLVLIPLSSSLSLELIMAFEAFGPVPSMIDIIELIVALLVIAGVDVLALRDAMRAQAAIRERERAEALQARIDASTERYASFIHEARQTARFRHDARNHLQVLAALIDNGDFEAAEQYARELERVNRREARV